MNPIKIYTKKYTHTTNGQECTPYYKHIYFCGNILFNSYYIDRWFKYNGTVLHILGFRFTKCITTNK